MTAGSVRVIAGRGKDVVVWIDRAVFDSVFLIKAVAACAARVRKAFILECWLYTEQFLNSVLRNGRL